MKYLKLIVLLLAFWSAMNGSSSSSSSGGASLSSSSSSSSLGESKEVYKGLDYPDIEEVAPAPAAATIHLSTIPVTPKAKAAIAQFIDERGKTLPAISLGILQNTIRGAKSNENDVWEALVREVSTLGLSDLITELINNNWISSTGQGSWFGKTTSLLDFFLTMQNTNTYEANYALANLLLSKNKNLINAWNENGMTPLATLLDTMKNSYSGSAYHAEHIQGYLGKIQALLDNGAKISGVFSPEYMEINDIAPRYNSALRPARYNDQVKKLLEDHLERIQLTREAVAPTIHQHLPHILELIGGYTGEK
jgi:hypothetical protein